MRFCSYYLATGFQFNGQILNCASKVFDLRKPIECRGVNVALEVSVIEMANVDQFVQCNRHTQLNVCSSPLRRKNNDYIGIFYTIKFLLPNAF